jgi:hypothetical protein
MGEIRSVDDALTAAGVSAVKLAADSGVTLDYSTESVQVVEGQLSALHKSLSRSVPDSEVRRMSLMFGGYIAAVIKREHGGTWTTESKVNPGQPTFHVKGLELWPQVKVEKRLRGGRGQRVALRPGAAQRARREARTHMSRAVLRVVEKRLRTDSGRP